MVRPVAGMTCNDAGMAMDLTATVRLPSRTRRSPRIAIGVVLVGGAIVRIVDRPLVLLAIVVLMLVFVWSLWAAITHVRSVRVLAVAVSIAAVAGVVAIIIVGGPLDVIVGVILLSVGVVLVRYAVSRDTPSLKTRRYIGNARRPGAPRRADHEPALGRREGRDSSISSTSAGAGASSPSCCEPGDDLLDLARRADRRTEPT